MTSELPARKPLFPSRVGALIASPLCALAEVDRRGGGVRDAFYVLLIGTLAFRLEDLARALIGASTGTVLDTAKQMVMVLSQELRGAVSLVVLGGLMITILAGRGRRDPSLDIELAAAAYVCFYAGRALFRTLEFPGLLGPFHPALSQASAWSALVWFAVMLMLAVRVARRRPVRGAAPVQGPPSVAPLPSAPAVIRTSPRDRMAAGVLTVVFAGALVLQAGAAARAGRDAPPFALPRIDGKPGTMALSDLRGKVVLLDFWATWCAPCIEMLPTLHDLYAEWRPKGVEFVGINSDGPATSPEDVRTFLQRRPAPYPMVFDDGEVGGRYKVLALPHMVVVGRDGSVQKIFWGVTSRGAISTALEHALN